jgi:hypothetical protein
MRKALARLGTRKLDGRSAVAVAVKEFKHALADSLGGNITPQQAEVIEIIARSKVLLDTVDDWLFQQPTLISRRTRGLIPAAAQRMGMANSLITNLEKLGLEPMPVA